MFINDNALTRESAETANDSVEMLAKFCNRLLKRFRGVNDALKDNLNDVVSSRL